MLKSICLASLAFFGLLTPPAGAVETQASLNGSAYTVIAPLYTGSNGTLSFIRLFNGGSAATTFNVTVVNADNGFTLGGASIQVPANASPQYPLTSAGGGNSIFALAGVTASGTANYALYIQDSDQYAGYEHVSYNGLTTLFENNSACATAINLQLASTNSQVLTNVHTSALASGNYPSVITIHNYAGAPATDKIAVFDAATGISIGQLNQTIPANSSVTLSESQIEAQLNFRPTNVQPQINLIISNAAGGALSASSSQVIHNAQLGGDINMTNTCAMNAVAPTIVQVAPSVPVAYCGTSTGLTQYGLVTANFVASVAPSGRVKASSIGVAYGYYFIGESVGQLVGTTVILTSVLTGQTSAGTATIQNGVLTGSAPNPYGGTSTFSGSTAACAS